MSFAMNLFRQVAKENPGNFFISSASVLSALAIATAAANGETETQMDQVLDLVGPYEDKHLTMGAQLSSLRSDKLALANRLWVNDKFTLKGDFANFVGDAYQTKIGDVDVSDPENEAERINRWCEKSTNGKIKDVVSADSVNDDLYAILINAIAYQGSWVKKFEAKRTVPFNWTLESGETVEVPVMQQTLDCPYWRRDGMHAIALDLEGDVAMVLVMPEDGSEVTLDQIVETLPEGYLSDILNSYQDEVIVGLAKWEFEGTYDLIPTCQELGIRDAFEEGLANFSRMAKESIYISAILHKTSVKVNEEGAEMSAVTKVSFGLESCMAQPKTFITTEPFVFFAVDKKSGTTLFSGRVSDPR